MMVEAPFILIKTGYSVKALPISRTIIGVPGVSLIPCISNESREDRTQVDSVGVVILKFISWIIHGCG